MAILNLLADSMCIITMYPKKWDSRNLEYLVQL